MAVKVAVAESPGSLAIAATVFAPAPGLEAGSAKLAVKAPPPETVITEGVVVSVPLEYTRVMVAPGVNPEPLAVTGAPIGPEAAPRLIDAPVVLGVMVKLSNAAIEPLLSLTMTRPVRPDGPRMVEAGMAPEGFVMNWRVEEQAVALETLVSPDSKQ